jgi:DNA-directed RNA polymerase subunit RPC12/RpoP
MDMIEYAKTWAEVLSRECESADVMGTTDADGAAWFFEMPDGIKGCVSCESNDDDLKFATASIAIVLASLEGVSDREILEIYKKNGLFFNASLVVLGDGEQKLLLLQSRHRIEQFPPSAFANELEFLRKQYERVMLGPERAPEIENPPGPENPDEREEAQDPEALRRILKHLPPEDAELTSIECPECGSENEMIVFRTLRIYFDLELQEMLLEGKVNLYRCSKCSYSNHLPLPFRVLSRWGGWDYIPWESAGDPEFLDRMIFEESQSWHDRGKRVFSKEELAREVAFELTVQQRLQEHAEHFRQLTIPEDVLKKIAGTYKKRKLKVIYYISTFLNEGVNYTQSEVDHIIQGCLSLLKKNDFSGSALDCDHIRSALCELKFLARTRDCSRYWKVPHGMPAG